MLVRLVALTDDGYELVEDLFLRAEFQLRLLCHVLEQEQSSLELGVDDLANVVGSQFIGLIAAEALLLLDTLCERCGLWLRHARALQGMLLLVCGCVQA